jgi:protein TonB
MKPKVGIPTPVSGPIADTTALVPPGAESDPGVQPNEPGSPGVGEPGSTGGNDSDNEPPDPFVPFEHPPEAVKHVQPKYPELATRAGIEGTVWVKIWIDKAGKPRKAVVTKSEAEIFNQPATEAAMQWVFTPALMKNGPVSVWVSVPFRFKLQGK